MQHERLGDPARYHVLHVCVVDANAVLAGATFATLQAAGSGRLHELAVRWDGGQPDAVTFYVALSCSRVLALRRVGLGWSAGALWRVKWH